MPFEPTLPIDPANKAVRVNVVAGGGAGGGTSSAVDAAYPASATAAGAKATAAAPTDGEGKMVPLSVDLAGNLRTIGALPLGAATGARQDTGNASLASIDAKLANPLPVSGTFWQATQAVSAASLPLPSGAATAAKQDTGNTSLVSIDTKLTNPLPVSGTVTSNQGTAAAGSGAWPVEVTEDTTNTVVKPGDATNKAIRVNVVASSGSTTFFGITESSTGDGTTATLTLGHTPTDEPRVFVARIRQILGTDYTRSGAVITWIVIPSSGDSIQVDYTWSMASATLAATLVVDVNGNVQPTGDSSARTIHTTLDNSTLPLPTGAATEATLALEMSAAVNSQRILYTQLVNQRAALQMQAAATGLAMFLPELPAFLGA